MRVTIAERLGLSLARGTRQAIPRHIPDDPECDPRAPEFVQPEKVVRLVDAPSAKTIPVLRVTWWCNYCQEDHDSQCPESEPRVRGEMVWVHKTAPTLVIEGRPGMSPEEHAAGRRR